MYKEPFHAKKLFYKWQSHALSTAAITLATLSPSIAALTIPPA
jgi:hypothetical protein